MDHETIPIELALELFGGSGAVIAAAWTVWRFIDARIDRVRVEGDAKIAALDARIEAVREACASSADIGRLEQAIGTLHRRLDELFKTLINFGKDTS